MKFAIIFFLFLSVTNAMTYAEQEQYDNWAREQREALYNKAINAKNQRIYNQQNAYKNDPLYKQFLAEQQQKEKDKQLKKYIIEISFFAFLTLLILFLMYKFTTIKLLPFLKTPKNEKKRYRLKIVATIFWIIGVLLTTLINGSHTWLFDREMYQFIFIGLLPPALFWSYYWIKSAKD